jgi:hypothetical protein
MDRRKSTQECTVKTKIDEYTTHISVTHNLKIETAEKGVVPVQITFCLRKTRWFNGKYGTNPSTVSSPPKTLNTRCPISSTNLSSVSVTSPSFLTKNRSMPVLSLRHEARFERHIHSQRAYRGPYTLLGTGLALFFLESARIVGGRKTAVRGQWPNGRMRAGGRVTAGIGRMRV